MLRRNTAANFAAQLYASLLQFAFVPVYIHYIGVAGFGLVGLYAILQAAFNLLDFGMTPTLTREVARYSGGGSEPGRLRDFLRSLEWCGLGSFLLVSVVVVAAGGAISRAWISSGEVSSTAVHVAIAVTAQVAALRLIEGIYRGCLNGLQQQVTLNALSSFTATLRAVPTVAILAFVSPTVEAYFYSQLAAAAVSVVLFRTVARRRLPDELRRGRFDPAALAHFGRFAGAMFVSALAGSGLVLAEKLTLSKLLSLTSYGYYTLAGLAASAILNFVYPITQAWSPRLAQLHAAGDKRAAAETFHRGAQAVAVLAGSAAVWLMVFAFPILEIWTRKPAIAAASADLVQILTVANLMTALISMPVQLQIAYKLVRVFVISELVALVVVVPAILLITPVYGAWGAAACLASLQFGVGVYLFTAGLPTTLPGGRWRWLVHDTMAPLAAAAAAALLLDGAGRAIGVPAWLIVLVSPPIVAGAALLAVPSLRIEALRLVEGPRRSKP